MKRDNNILLALAIAGTITAILMIFYGCSTPRQTDTDQDWPGLNVYHDDFYEGDVHDPVVDSPDQVPEHRVWIDAGFLNDSTVLIGYPKCKHNGALYTTSMYCPDNPGCNKTKCMQCGQEVKPQFTINTTPDRPAQDGCDHIYVATAIPDTDSSAYYLYAFLNEENITVSFECVCIKCFKLNSCF